MKTIAFIAPLAILFAACNQKPSSLNATDLAVENLKGKVQEVQTDTYTVDSTGKMGSMDTCCNYTEQFDQNGYTAKYITRDGKENVKSESSYQHDQNGMMLGTTTMSKGKTTSSMTLESKDGKYTLAKSYDSTGKMDSYYSDVTQNKFGMVTSAKQYKPDSTLKSSFTNKYDSIYYVGGISNDSSGKTTYSSNIKLNDKNDPAEVTETTVTKDSSKTTVTTYNYGDLDSQGNWTTQTTYNDKGKPTKIIKRTITYYKQ